MCATRFSTSWVAHLRMTERNTTKRGYAIWKRRQDQCQLRRWLEKWCRFCFQTWYFCEEGVYKVYDKKVWNPIYCSLSWWITSAISRWTGWHTHKSTTRSRRKIEKVPRGIRGEKSSKDMASSRNLVSTIGALASPKVGDGTRCPEG